MKEKQEARTDLNLLESIKCEVNTVNRMREEAVE